MEDLQRCLELSPDEKNIQEFHSMMQSLVGETGNLYTKAIIAFNNNKFEEAVELFGKAITYELQHAHSKELIAEIADCKHSCYIQLKE